MHLLKGSPLVIFSIKIKCFFSNINTILINNYITVSRYYDVLFLFKFEVQYYCIVTVVKVRGKRWHMEAQRYELRTFKR